MGCESDWPIPIKSSMFLMHVRSELSHKVASMYSGCDILQLALDAVLELVNELYNIKIDVEYVWLCERNAEKVQFLMGQHSPPLVFRDAGQIVELFAHDCVSDSMQAVPYCDLLVAGFPCTSKTSLSSLASKFKQCIRDGEGSTGEGFEDVRGYIEVNKPTFVILENLASLAAKSEDTEESEADYIVKRLGQLGYWCTYQVFEARDHGSMAYRERIYFVASLVGNQECAEMFLKVIIATAVGPGSIMTLYNIIVGWQVFQVMIRLCRFLDAGCIGLEASPS